MANHTPGFLRIVESVKSNIQEISIEDVCSWQSSKKEFVLIDTREDKEWMMNRIPGSIHIGKGVIERDIESQVPDANTQIVLYCGGGFRSALAAYSLVQMGYKNVYSMKEGIRGWMARSLPIED